MGLQMLQAMHGELTDLTPPGEIPPELAKASAHIKSLQRKMFEELEQSEGGGLQVPPEVQAMIEGMKMMRRSGP